VDRVAHRFFTGRRSPNYGSAFSGASGLIEYLNVPRVIGTVVSADKATLIELQSIYGVKDAYDLLEVILVDATNQRRMTEKR
jgi:hypothetical protein